MEAPSSKTAEREVRRPPARNVLEQYFRVEAELLEEENTERARFFDTYTLVELGLTLLREHLMDHHIDPDLKEHPKEILANWSVYLRDYKDGDAVLEKATFRENFAIERENTKMRPEESIAYNYQILTARGRRMNMRIRSDLVRLSIIPKEAPQDAELRDEMEALHG